MSASNLSVDAQLRYMQQWFEEWSELQRSDFLPILAEKVAKAACVNGIIHSMGAINCDEKPLNLFQCRVKLFNEWYPSWSEEEQKRLIKSLTDLDSQFATNLEAELNGTRVVDTGMPDYIQEFIDQNADNEAKEEASANVNQEPLKYEEVSSSEETVEVQEENCPEPQITDESEPNESIPESHAEPSVTQIEIAANS